MPTVRHEGASIMLWGCFAADGITQLQKVDGIMRNYKEQYLNLKSSARNLKLGRKWILQQNNDPKHTAHVVKKWPRDNQVQRSDLNPIENL